MSVVWKKKPNFQKFFSFSELKAQADKSTFLVSEKFRSLKNPLLGVHK